MWVEMLNSNQARMETNLQGAVAVAIVTAAKLETQTRLLLDSFGAPVYPLCQGQSSCRAGVHPWLQGDREAGSDAAASWVLPVLCCSPPVMGKAGMSLLTGKGKHSMGVRGCGMSCGAGTGNKTLQP